MRRFASKLISSVNGLRIRVASFRPQTTTIKESVGENHNLDVLRGAITQFSEGTSARQRLDGLSSWRIHPKAIEFATVDSHKSGGKADVVHATYQVDGGNYDKAVAVKKLRYHRGVERKRFENQFAHEVGMMAGLSHENIIELIGFVEDLENGTAWIILSWEPNGDVSEFLAKGEWEIPERLSLVSDYASGKKPVRSQQAFLLQIKDTFEGIKYLHSRQPPICHGDLKSFNILVSSEYRAVITDFGSARVISTPEDLDQSPPRAQGLSTAEPAGPPIQINAAGNQLTLTGPAWSLRWAAPEVVNGQRPGLSSDIWAAGWVCWELMTDKVPFPELNAAGVITLTVVQGNVPSPRQDGHLRQIVALCSLMTDCWAFEPKARPSISRCCNELQWMPSTLPSDANSSGPKVPSTDLLRGMGEMSYMQSDFEKAALLFQQALSLATSTGNETAAASALRWLGSVYRIQARYAQAEESYTRGEEIFTRIGDDVGRANALRGLGHVYRVQYKYTEAKESYTRAEEIFTRIGDDLGRGHALDGLGDVFREQCKYAEAEESYFRAQEIYACIGNDVDHAFTLEGLGDVYRAQSKYTEAEESFSRSHEIHARIGNDLGRANASLGLGRTYCAQSKYNEAEELFTRAQELYALIHNDLGQANTQRGLADLRWAQRRNDEAASHYTRARELFAQIGRTEDVEDCFRLAEECV